MFRPEHAGIETCFSQPRQQISHAARRVVDSIDRRHCVARIVGDHNIGHHKASTGHQSFSDPSEEVRFARSVEVVHRKCRNNEVELSLREGILQAADPEITLG